MGRCQHPNTYLAVLRCVNGAMHVGYRCDDCEGWGIREGQKGKWLPHEGIEIDVLPIVYEPRMETCYRCKKTKWCENHHYAPRKLFHDDADEWPTGWLCTPGCHEEWHRRIGHPIRGDNVD